MSHSICTVECEWIFGTITVYPRTVGGTRVEWMLHPQFRDPAPYTFQLQVGSTGNPLADDWCDVGLPVTDTYFAEDTEQRHFGTSQNMHYRVVVTTSLGSYASKPQHCFARLQKPDWLKVRKILRDTAHRLEKKAGNAGYLLKRRWYGTPCECSDPQTGECRNPQCTLCYGTSIVGGYFDPLPCIFAEFVPNSIRSHVSQLGTTSDGPVAGARMLSNPPLYSYDVWVDKKSDERWIIHKINTESEVRGVPVVLFPVELRLAPFSHVIYQLPITGLQTDESPCRI